jgi:hypothetical protein
MTFCLSFYDLFVFLGCRYDLGEGVGVGLVSFSNTSRLEFPLTAAAGQARARLADSVPDKYR